MIPIAAPLAPRARPAAQALRAGFCLIRAVAPDDRQ